MLSLGITERGLDRHDRRNAARPALENDLLTLNRRIDEFAEAIPCLIDRYCTHNDIIIHPGPAGKEPGATGGTLDLTNQSLL